VLALPQKDAIKKTGRLWMCLNTVRQPQPVDAANAQSLCDSQENEMGRTMAVRPTSDGVAFIVKVGACVEECFISREALDTLSKLKNIDGSDADPLELFLALELFIRAVATSHFARRGKGCPLRLTPEIINSAYCRKSLVP